MEKKIISVVIGNRRLQHEADPGNKTEMEFGTLIRETADTQPPTLQDFFIRLNELQKQHNDNYARDTSEKAT
ncbi:MAG TPA: hypothetical protein VFS36_16425 [Chitinophagaceae bacterium]|jgi:hypothetical protein|nr:hypothetical protein [Chitinophagaceae bacterium]